MNHSKLHIHYTFFSFHFVLAIAAVPFPFVYLSLHAYVSSFSCRHSRRVVRRAATTTPYTRGKETVQPLSSLLKIV